ncbi:VWA domain-containing protein [Myxococcota bacterium]|nr:VWA domain-containing protein [Myxococcota bacterium]
MPLPKLTTTLFATALFLAALPIVVGAPPREPPPATPVKVTTPEPTKTPPAEPRAPARKIQLALLLDTSSSMDGLIDQARSQLWKIVNELSAAKQSGQRAELELALFEYGKATLAADSGFIRLVVPFTKDLDLVSEHLFSLRTNGGDEHCGQVIDAATRQLEWSSDPKDLKLLFIAGNEPFTQGPVDFRRAIRAATSKGITVNTIFCGPEHAGVETGWRDGAMLADGRFLSIDHDAKVAHVTAPQDDEIARLGVVLNGTYVPYGAEGSAYAARQAVQDQNALSSAPGSMMQRSLSKASAAYSNSGWDLVDATRDGAVDVERLADGQLPAELRGKPAAERRAWVEAKAKERADLQTRIQALATERAAWIAKNTAETRASGADTLDRAMSTAVRAQAEKRGWSF